MEKKTRRRQQIIVENKPLKFLCVHVENHITVSPPSIYTTKQSIQQRLEPAKRKPWPRGKSGAERKRRSFINFLRKVKLKNNFLHKSWGRAKKLQSRKKYNPPSWIDKVLLYQEEKIILKRVCNSLSTIVK